MPVDGSGGDGDDDDAVLSARLSLAEANKRKNSAVWGFERDIRLLRERVRAIESERRADESRDVVVASLLASIQKLETEIERIVGSGRGRESSRRLQEGAAAAAVGVR